VRYFLDTEFQERGHLLLPISVGIVAEDGREFYAECAEFISGQASRWVRDNVLPKLTGPAMLRPEMQAALTEFVTGDPEFWAYYASYDWVVLCQIMGGLMNLPAGWPKHINDILWLGETREQSRPDHHALRDARWDRMVWQQMKVAA
jgi:hypothetical protein